MEDCVAVVYVVVAVFVVAVGAGAGFVACADRVAQLQLVQHSLVLRQAPLETVLHRDAQVAGEAAE